MTAKQAGRAYRSSSAASTEHHNLPLTCALRTLSQDRPPLVPPTPFWTLRAAAVRSVRRAIGIADPTRPLFLAGSRTGQSHLGVRSKSSDLARSSGDVPRARTPPSCAATVQIPQKIDGITAPPNTSASCHKRSWLHNHRPSSAAASTRNHKSLRRRPLTRRWWTFDLVHTNGSAFAL
jgi:hypothetical protein